MLTLICFVTFGFPGLTRPARSQGLSILGSAPAIRPASSRVLRARSARGDHRSYAEDAPERFDSLLGLVAHVLQLQAVVVLHAERFVCPNKTRVVDHGLEVVQDSAPERCEHSEADIFRARFDFESIAVIPRYERLAPPTIEHRHCVLIHCGAWYVSTLKDRPLIYCLASRLLSE